MICKKCGNEIDNDSVFCDKCGAEVTKEEAASPATESEEAKETAEAKNEETKENEKAPSPAPSKKKSKTPLIIGILVAVAGVAVICFACLALLGGLIFGSMGAENEYVVETGADDRYGGVAFDMTFGDFIEKYNDLIEENEEYSTIADMQKLSYFDFRNDGVKDGIHGYIYTFSYTTGTYPYVTNHELASLYIGVNPETEKIQCVKYVWQADNYNTDDAMLNYYYNVPAKIFSIFYSEIDYPYGGDYSDYMDFLDTLIDSNKSFSSAGNTVYGLFDTGTTEYYGIQFIAMTEDSELFDSF